MSHRRLALFVVSFYYFFHNSTAVAMKTSDFLKKYSLNNVIIIFDERYMTYPSEFS